MSYSKDITRVVTARREEIEDDLMMSRRIRDRATVDLGEAQRRVAAFEALLSFAENSEAERSAPEKMTLHAAMRKVLEDAPAGMMRAGDLATEIDRRKLYRMRDGRPVEAQQIHARIGHYRDDFSKEGTFIKLT